MSSTTRTDASLDALLHELVQNADDWAALKSDLIDSPADSSSPSSADGQQHPCFDQLSRAISSHVTDLLMRRLRLAGGGGRDSEAENEDTDDEDRPWIDERGRERRGRGFPVHPARLDSESESLSSRESPVAAVAASAAPPPVVRGRATARAAAGPPSAMGSRAGSSCSLATILKFADFVQNGSIEEMVVVSEEEKGSRYHSENRLDRAYPAPRTNETPLENRASRLRRMSIERKQADRNARSAAASPMPQRRSLSRRSSGCGGQ